MSPNLCCQNIPSVSKHFSTLLRILKKDHFEAHMLEFYSKIFTVQAPPSEFINITRMHSSRMHTARSSSRLLGGGVCLSACWDTPPWVWAWRPSQCGPGNPPPGIGLETPPGQTPQLPPWVWAWRPPPGQTPQLPPGCGPVDPSRPDP